MVDLFESSSSVTVQEFEVIINRRTKETATTYNVIGLLKGNDPILKDEFVIIGGHYDTTPNPPKARRLFFDNINNGADDNASGTAMVLELFEKYASTNTNKRSLVFILFGGEELGLLGSKHFTENPTINLDKVQLMVNLDMVGRLDKEKNVYLGGVPTGYGLSKDIQPFFNQSELKVTSYEHTASGVRSLFSRSDHYNFYKKNIPSLFFFTGIHKDYHSPRDEAKLVNYNGLKLISDLAEKVIDNAANRNDRYEFKALPKLEEESKQAPARMKVTLGVMPDYAHAGNGLKIDSVIDDRPAKKSGLKDGDIVLKIKEVDITDIYKYMEALSVIEPGSTVQVTIKRNNEELLFDVTF
jgi:Zn-dependent M28 family amino/carboxypeptidase